MEDSQSEAGPSHNATLIVDNKVEDAAEVSKMMCNNGQGEGQNILDKLKTSAEVGGGEDKSHFDETSSRVLDEENDESNGKKVVRFSSKSEIIPRSCIYRDEETVTETEGEEEEEENDDSDIELPFVVDEDVLTFDDDFRPNRCTSQTQMINLNLPMIDRPRAGPSFVSERVSDNTFLQEYLQVSLTCAGEPAQEKPQDWKLTQAETASIRVDGSHHKFVRGDSNENFDDMIENDGRGRIEGLPSRLEIGSNGDSDVSLKMSIDMMLPEDLKRTISLTSIDDEVILSEGGLDALINQNQHDVDEEIQEKVDQVVFDPVVDSETSSCSDDEETSEYSEESTAAADEQDKKKIVFSFRKLPISPPLSLSRQIMPAFENHPQAHDGLKETKTKGGRNDSLSSATSSSTNPMTDFYFDENGAEDFEYYDENNYDGGESESEKSCHDAAGPYKKLKDDDKKALIKEKKKNGGGLLKRFFSLNKKNKVVDSSTIDDGDCDLDDSLDINGNKKMGLDDVGPEEKSKSSIFSKIFGVLFAPFTNLFKSKSKN